MACLGGIGCGGTSSETPWPVEPPHIDIEADSDRDLRQMDKSKEPAVPPPEAEPPPTQSF